ncbi:GSCOCG00012013001-RA-CDS, partial [Cotesia congregata]
QLERKNNINNKNIENRVNMNINIEDADEEDNVDLRANEPLYAGASINATESMLLILTLLVNHNLTMTCIEDIIKVIHLHCPSQDLQKNSLYKFKKFFNLEQEN